MKKNAILCDDSLFEIDPAYLEGALAMRRGVPWGTGNPYRANSRRHDQWEFGHVNESAREHIRFGVDIVAAPLSGIRFEIDSSVPRDAHCSVDREWYRSELSRRTRTATGVNTELAC